MRSCWVVLLFIPALQRSVGTDAFATLCQTNNHVLSRHHYWRQRPSCCRLQGKQESDEPDLEDHVAEPDAVEPMSKAKWKKKRYLMMQDVQELIKKRDKHAPKKAHEMVTRMHNWSQVHQNEDFNPDEQIYNMWINAISKCSRRDDAGKEAEAVLEEMRRNGLEPNVISYTTVMDAYAHSSGRRNRAAQEAERVMFDLIELQVMKPEVDLKISSITLDTALKAWANRGDFEGANHAQDILERLEKLQRVDICPTAHSYGTVVHAWASCNGGIEAAENAEAILNHMLEPNQRVKPDTVVFNSVINAYANAKGPQAGAKAAELLERMRTLHNPEKGLDTKPDSVTYSSVLSAWSHSDTPNAAMETERILKGMQEAHRESPCTSPAPNTGSFNNVLHAWSRSSSPKAAERAVKVLEFMIKSNQKMIAPDVISFTSVLNALAKSKDPEKASKTRQLLDKMIKKYEQTNEPALKPSPIPFNAVLNACAFSASDTKEEQQKAALLIGTATFTELKRVSHPDTVSYGNMMKCLHNLMPPGAQRNDMALKLFQRCANDGLVGELVWTEVRRTVQSRVLSKALSGDLDKGQAPSKLHVQDLPKRWTNRVRGDKLAARRRSQAQARKRSTTRRKSSTQKKRAPERRFRAISEPSFESGKDL